MAKRYELSDEAWAIVADVFVKKRNRSRPRLSDSVSGPRCINGIGRGEIKALSTRYIRLNLKLKDQGFIDLQVWMIDLTGVRATRASSKARKKGA